MPFRMLTPDLSCAQGLIPQEMDWRPVASIYVMIFVVTLGATITNPVLPFFATAFGATPVQVTYLFSFPGLAAILVSPLVIRFSTRYGPRPTFLCALFGAAICSLWAGLSPNYWSLLGARSLMRAFGDIAPTAQTYLSGFYTPPLRDDLLSWLTAVSQFAGLFGPGLGGGLSKFGLRVPIFINAGLSLLASVLVYAYLPADKIVPKQRPPGSPTGERPPGSPTRAEYVAVALLMLCRGTAAAANLSDAAIMALYGKRVFDLDALHIGFIDLLSACLVLAMTIWVQPLLRRRLGAINACVLLSFVQGSALLCMAKAVSLWTLIGAACVERMAGQTLLSIYPVIVSACGSETCRQWRNVMVSNAKLISLFAVPPVLGYAFEYLPVCPFLIGVACCAFNCLTIPILRHRSTYSEQPTVSFPRSYTKKDVDDLGYFMAELLTRRNYDFVGKKEEVYNLLSTLIPEMRDEEQGVLAKQEYENRPMGVTVQA